MPGLWTTEFGELGATLKALEDLGVTLAHLKRLRRDKAYARAVAEVVHSGRSDGRPKSHTIARSILGRNFFGVEDWLVYYGIMLTDEEIDDVSEFSWGVETLMAPCPFYKGKQIKDTHFAYLGLSGNQGVPLTIMELVGMHSLAEHPMFQQTQAYFTHDGREVGPGYWYENELFACNETCEFKWYLSPIDDFPLWNRKPKLQQALLGQSLPQKYVSLSAVELVTRNLLYYRKHRVVPITEMATRTLYDHLGTKTRIWCAYRSGKNMAGMYICCPPVNDASKGTEYALTRI